MEKWTWGDPIPLSPEPQSEARGDLVRRYEAILLGLFATIVVVVTGIYALRQSRHEPRLARLQVALTDLANGEVGISLGDRGRDTIARIAAMIERTSRVMARDRRRLAAMKNLSAWQEAARRHAHEMSTPLTAARLELTKIEDLLEKNPPEGSPEVREAVGSVLHELDRLHHFTREFTSFARIPPPRLIPTDLRELALRFVQKYESAWENLEISLEDAGNEEPRPVAADTEMLRQVLVNLCENSSRAAGTRRVCVALRTAAVNGEVLLEVDDDGPGISDEVRDRLFEPYSTTRSVGEGMGLGLAICRKILLDHSGDLRLARSSSAGTCFRLVLPSRTIAG